MTLRRTLAALLVALPLSSFVAGCKGKDGDTTDQQALERQQTQRDLDLALQPDSTQQPKLQDVPLTVPPSQQPTPSAQPAPQAPPAP
ncbi:MAG: hypothetical protein JWM27_3168, partial [Gemmatimonadetes bacterium]|nr:hypothetical protein [Gemmatimonadota bacterium]